MTSLKRHHLEIISQLDFIIVFEVIKLTKKYIKIWYHSITIPVDKQISLSNESVLKPNSINFKFYILSGKWLKRYLETATFLILFHIHDGLKFNKGVEDGLFISIISITLGSSWVVVTFFFFFFLVFFD